MSQLDNTSEIKLPSYQGERILIANKNGEVNSNI